jgi:hypothetical protein
MTVQYYKQVIKVVVLSEGYDGGGPPNWQRLEDVARDIIYGDCSGEWHVDETVELTPKQVAEELMKQGSDPGFFQLNEDGTPEEGWE